eukprot:785013_1
MRDFNTGWLNMSVEQKLQLAEEENTKMKHYFSSHIASLRSLLLDKENIIENLVARFNISSIESVELRLIETPDDEEHAQELRRKAEALSQRLILENYELREMVNELRDDNFHIRNEVYEGIDKINRQTLQIERLKKQIDGVEEDASDPSADERFIWMDRTKMNKLNKKIADYQINHVELQTENSALRRCTRYITKIEAYLGITIFELIPLKLNDHYKRIYQRLFVGFNREFERNNTLSNHIPLSVAQITSFYYPWFLL